MATGLLAVATDAAALLDDRLELFVSETVTSDSNVFRLSNDQDTRALLGRSKKSDLLTTTSAGFNFNAPISLQRVQLGLKLDDVRYNRFSELDHQGRDGYATWLWQVGDRLNGQLGYTEAKHLTSFVDIRDIRRNSQDTKRLFGNAVYMLTPRWELEAGLAEETRRNSLQAVRENDVEVSSADASISYVSPAKNKIGLSLRVQDADYPHPDLVGGALLDNNYVQRRLGLITDWNITAKSHLNVRVDRLSREFDSPARQDYTGTVFRASYDWKATEKFLLNAVAQRDISINEEATTNFVLARGVALSPRLTLSEKVKIFGVFDYSHREYLSAPIAVLGNDNRVDHVRTAGASVSYRPLRSLTLLLSGQHQKRSSNVPLLDNADTLISINARLAF